MGAMVSGNQICANHVFGRFMQTFPSCLDEEFLADIGRMQAVLARAGRHTSEAEVTQAWKRYLRTLNADWMQIDEDSEQLLNRLLVELHREV